MRLELSPLPHTWFVDLDGTLVEHNGYKKYGKDRLLDGAAEFIGSIPEEDTIIITTSRTQEYKELTETFLRENNIRYDQIIYNLPYGERILINDNKPSGLTMGYSVNVKRDSAVYVEICVDNGK